VIKSLPELPADQCALVQLRTDDDEEFVLAAREALTGVAHYDIVVRTFSGSGPVTEFDPELEEQNANEQLAAITERHAPDPDVRAACMEIQETGDPETVISRWVGKYVGAADA